MRLPTFPINTLTPARRRKTEVRYQPDSPSFPHVFCPAVSSPTLLRGPAFGMRRQSGSQSVIRTDAIALRDASVSSLQLRERGAWVSAVGSACASLWLAVARVSRAPDRPSFPAWTIEEFGGFTGRPCRRCPGPWLPVRAPVPRAGSFRRSWTLRFHSPEADAREVRFASQAQRCRHLPAHDWLAPAGILSSPRPRAPRRPTPIHPEASVDLETSLRRGEGT
jgi:hypothetical protein